MEQPNEGGATVNNTLFNYTTLGISRQVLGEYMNKLDWSYFFTGTFKSDSIRDRDAVKCFFKWLNSMIWLHDIKEYGYAYFLEEGHCRNVPHIHSLLYLPTYHRSKRLASWWQVWFKRYGRCQIEKYNKDIGAGYYLTKYVVKEYFKNNRDKYTNDWDIYYPIQKNPLDKSIALCYNLSKGEIK